MSKIKVLIVDDSALIRAALTRILSMDDDIEVVGAAPDPYIAVEKIKKLNPDVITLDIEMPRMDGLTFLDKLMKSHPMPVVMISTWTKRNSDKAIRALALGAFDFVEKPSNNENISDLATEIITKVKNAAACEVKNLRTNLLSLNKSESFELSSEQPTDKDKANVMTSIYGAKPNKAVSAPGKKSDKLILVGSSTGGTMALETIIKKLPANMPGIVIVQHMPENFTKAFADRLNSLYDLYIKEAEDGEPVCDGTVYIAPGGKQCYLRRIMGSYTIQINDDPPVNKHKPSVDALFSSAAELTCRNMVGVILTGMGKDGAQGMLEMRKAGSYNIGQDEVSCVVYGMPKEAYDIGAVHEVLSLDKIASRLANLIV